MTEKVPDFNVYFAEENLLVVEADELLLPCHTSSPSLEFIVQTLVQGMNIIFDLSKTKAMDECVTGYFLEAFYQSKDRGSFLAISGAMDEKKYWRLYVNMIDKIIPMYADVDAAVQAYKSKK